MPRRGRVPVSLTPLPRYETRASVRSISCDRWTSINIGSVMRSLRSSSHFSFYQTPFSVPWHHLTLGCHVSSGSSWSWQFLRCSSFLMTSTTSRPIGQVFCRMCLVLDFPMFFSVLETKTTEVRSVLISSCKGRILHPWRVTVDVDLDQAEVICRISVLWSYFPTFLHYFCRKAITLSSHLRASSVPSSRGEHVDVHHSQLFCIRYTSIPHLFIQSFTPAWTHRYFFF